MPGCHTFAKVGKGLAPTLAFLIAAGAATAAPCGLLCLLADGNATLDVDHLYSDGVYSWEVDGVEQVNERYWFWLRTGPSGSGAPGPEFRLDDEDTNFGSGSGFQLVSSDLVGNTLSLRYQGRGLQVDLDWVLTGGSPGSGESSIQVDVLLTNVSGAALDGSWFEFADFDVNDNNNMETAVLSAPGRVLQADVASGAVLEYDATRVPTHWEIGAEFTPGVDDLLDLLNDGLPTVLADVGSPFGPGGAEFAFQHDLAAFANGASVAYTTTITAPAPAGGAQLLAGVALLFRLYAVHRRRRGDQRI